jgi:periplasmic divalent cation tolerance protein
MTDKRIVFSTCSSREEARKLAEALLQEQVAACVNIVGPIESVYLWAGEVKHDEEFLLVIKTTEQRFAAVRDVITGRHSYDVPECVSVAVDDGSTDYLKWIGESVL